MEPAEKSIRHLDEFNRRRIERIVIFTVIVLIGWLFYVSENAVLYCVIMLLNIFMCVYLLIKKNKQACDFHSLMIRFLVTDLVVFFGWLLMLYSFNHPIKATLTGGVLVSCLLFSAGTAHFMSRCTSLSKEHLKLIDQLLSDENQIDSFILMNTYAQVNLCGNIDRRFPLIETGNTRLKQAEKDEILLVFLHRSKFKWLREYHYDQNRNDSFGRNICLIKRDMITKL